MQDALIHAGYGADVWGLRHDNYGQVPDFNAYDVIVVAENYELEWLPDLSTVTKPLKIHWVIDLHLVGPEAYLPVSRQCDIVIHATKSLIEPYRLQAPQAHHRWFPNAIDSRYFDSTKLPVIPRDRSLVFVGGRGTREAILAKMEAEAGLKYHYGVTGWDYISLLHRAKMQFNEPAAGDINYRNFETVAMGACLLTRADPDLEELGFRHKENCLTYLTQGEAVALAKEALVDGSWKQIAANGLKLAKRHSYRARVNQLVEALGFKTAFGGSGITRELFDCILKVLPQGKRILELGAGLVSTPLLSLTYKLTSVEQDACYLPKCVDVEAVHAPLRSGWYDVEIIKCIRQDYDLILVDGPSGEDSRMGFAENLDLFRRDVPIIFDDTFREQQRILAERVAAALGRTLEWHEHFAILL